MTKSTGKAKLGSKSQDSIPALQPAILESIFKAVRLAICHLVYAELVLCQLYLIYFEKMIKTDK